MRIACSTSAFKVPLDEALARVAGLGFEAVDLICIPGWGHVVPADLAADFEPAASRIEQALHQAGLTTVAMNLAVPHTHQRDDAQVNADRLKYVGAVTRLMNRLGVSVCSFYPGYRAEGRDWEAVLADSVETIREMLRAAAGAGVTLAVEPHFATPYETVEQGQRLLEALPELTVAYDPSHYALQEIPLSQTESLLDRASHVHLRDAAPGKMCVPYGQGTVDFDWLMAALADRGYDGNFSIEYLPKEGSDPADSIARLRDDLADKIRR